jgi:preprotein translocase subunit SecB
MAEKLSYPFRLIKAFYVNLDFHRKPLVAPNVNLNIRIEFKATLDNYPKVIQVNGSILTPEDTPIVFKIELVGLFEYIGKDTEKDKLLFPEFLGNQGIYMLWPYLSQLIAFITSQMGMPPVDVIMPLDFHLEHELIKKEPES